MEVILIFEVVFIFEVIFIFEVVFIFGALIILEHSMVDVSIETSQEANWNKWAGRHTGPRIESG